MSDKPKVYGFCDAGCKFEVPHKNDVVGKPLAVNVTLMASSWGNGVYKWEHTSITKSCPIEITPQEGITTEQLEALQRANIYGGKQVANDTANGITGSIELVAYGKEPEINIPVTMIIWGDIL